jgi:2-oxo-4-hydroxy-4-carboxy-5-ureidoimidazoline decarboxylase
MTSAHNMATPSPTGLAAFNALPAPRARELLLTCCTARRWAGEVAAGRPYPSLHALVRAASDALTDRDVSDALAGHPRIGEPGAGGLSRSEQAAVSGGAADLRARLAEGNRLYEARFGHIYLVCAVGRTAAELLGVLRHRLGNDPATERVIVLTELRKINKLRLERLIGR